MGLFYMITGKPVYSQKVIKRGQHSFANRFGGLRILPGNHTLIAYNKGLPQTGFFKQGAPRY